jgi:hypothetical protein
VGAQTKGSRTDGSVYTTVVEQALHPEYNEVSEENDFMILKLGAWVSLSIKILLLNNVELMF